MPAARDGARRLHAHPLQRDVERDGTRERCAPGQVQSFSDGYLEPVAISGRHRLRLWFEIVHQQAYDAVRPSAITRQLQALALRGSIVSTPLPYHAASRRVPRSGWAGLRWSGATPRRPALTAAGFHILAHQRIASRLERLLNDALEAHDPTRAAFQAFGIQIGAPDAHKPEPDVAVLDAEIAPVQRLATRAYLLAEILSSKDDELTGPNGSSWIETKRALYRAHPAAVAVLSTWQDRCEVLVETREGENWTAAVLGSPGDTLALPAFGLSCRVGELYAGVPLPPRP